jgi:hypothetical protein
MYDRPFGVEIECLSNGQGVYGTMNLLAKNGFNNSRWNVGSDGSEVEIRSPILRGTEGLRELKGVMNLLSENGYDTTDSDGMHCHFDARDLNETDIYRVIKSWDNCSDIICQFVGERFENEYCGYGYNFEALEAGQDEYGYKHSVWHYDGEKCFAIEPRSRLRTLEFRQHYGTLDFDEARAWILFVQAFIKNVANRKSVIEKVSMSDLFRITRTYKIAQKNLSARKASFSYDDRW